MSVIKADRYEIPFKKYLTFPADEKILGLLLEEHYDKKYQIKFGEDSVECGDIPKGVADLVESYDCIVEKLNILKYRGRSKLFGKIPVETKNFGDEIEVRITDTTKESLDNTVKYIEQEFLKYGVKPKICSWDREEPIIKNKEDEDNEYTINMGLVPKEDIIERPEKDGILEVPKFTVNKEKMNQKEIKCPECSSEDIILLLQTPNGNRQKCQNCGEIFVSEVDKE